MFNKAVLVSRILLGLIFLIFGVNGLMYFTMGNGFIPMPPPSAEMMPIMTGFMATKYLMPLVKLIEIVAGLMLLSGFFINASIVLLAPILVNIAGIHFIVDTAGAPMTVVLLILFAVILKSRWSDFTVLLKMK
jgi:putative oxidoreductase